MKSINCLAAFAAPFGIEVYFLPYAPEDEPSDIVDEIVFYGYGCACKCASDSLEELVSDLQAGFVGCYKEIAKDAQQNEFISAMNGFVRVLRTIA